MTKQQAFEILSKHTQRYTVSKIREMIHLVGVARAAAITIEVLSSKLKDVPKADIEEWVIKSFHYVNEQTRLQ